MKYILILLITGLLSCSQKREINPDPLVIKDTVTLAPNQKGFVHEVYNPSRGKVKVVISNYQDSTKTFIIDVKEK